MVRYAFLLGSAKVGFIQKKISQFYASLIGENRFNERDIAVFPNGISELMLEYALNNAIEQDNCTECPIERLLLYICTSSPVSDSDEIIWLGGEEIRKDVIRHYASLLGNRFQVIYNSDRKEISEAELGYERIG